MKLPAMWGAILTALQDHAPEAFIGGGALRDMQMERPVKDVDLFMSEAEQFSPDRRALMAAFGYQSSDYINFDYTNGDHTLVDAWTFEKPGATPFNLIRLRSDYDFPSALQRFDLGICQIGHNGREVHRTDAFKADIKGQHMTVVRCENADQMAHTKARHARLQAKYDGWPLVIPDRFQLFV